MKFGSIQGRRTRPSGMTLIEVLALISVLLVIGISAARILGQLTSTGNELRNAQQARESVARIAAKFRADVAAATELGVTDNAQALELRQQDRLVRYAWSGGRGELQREVTHQQDLVSRDRFAVQGGRIARFELQGQWVRLRVELPDQPAAAPASRIPPAWIIEGRAP